MMLTFFIVAWLIGSALCQFPSTPKGVTVLKSKYHDGVKISYKEPGLCETTPGVRSFAGYVHLPPGLLTDINGEEQDYPINAFFWFFESRKDPANAPLSIWLNGGAGASSLMGLLQENGPCFVGNDSNSTFLNPWSWNNEVNMLYLDQPVQVGYSYDVPTKGTYDLENQLVIPTNFTDDIPRHNFTQLPGTFSSQSNSSTANTTLHAAHAIWHFAQTWFFEFPYYKPNDDRISLWTESYGGEYGPAFWRFFQEQNEKILNGSIKERGTKYIHLDTLGIINGLLDASVQFTSYPDMAHNNTYGIKVYNDSQYESVMQAWSKPGGCQDQIAECMKLARELDPDRRGNIPEVNAVCAAAEDSSFEKLLSPYFSSDHGWMDIAHPKHDPFPEPYMYGYLNQAWVQEALGVPVNHTFASRTVNEDFSASGDGVRAGSLDAVAYLLDTCVKVHMMYGDRDFACNWIGGERASLAVNYSGAEGFRNAGYTPLISSLSIVGQVRQYGNYSFSRVYQAGHEVPSYQPQASYDIFMRAMFNRDIATGILPVGDTYATIGPSSTWHIKNAIRPAPEPMCYILNRETCTDEAWAKVKNGTARVRDFILLEDDDDNSDDRGDEAEGGRQAPLGWEVRGTDAQEVLGWVLDL